MKKYLIRAGFSPFDNFSPEYMLNHSRLLGNNSGNMLYAYSVWRTLMTEDCTLVPTGYKYAYTDEEIEEINATYSAFIIPLANAFREDFKRELRGLTELIKKLNIPVYVIGVGINFPYEPDFDKHYSFDEAVKDFVKAVLKKSALIGVRGELTAKYLEGLGFKYDKHFTPIGCPSMYTFGEQLNIKKPDITENSKIVFNHSTQAPDSVLDFTNRTIKQFPNHYMVLQTTKEFFFVYSGASYMYKSDRAFPCKTMNDQLYLDNRIRFFTNEPSWLDFTRNADLCFGPRLHGNIAALISGTPSIMFPKDARMRELADYHNITCVTPDELEGKTLFDLASKVDFEAPLKVQTQNFGHYVDFLNKNGIDHIYKDSWNPTDTAFDKMIAGIDFKDGIDTIKSCTPEEANLRTENFYKYVWDKTSSLEKRNKRLRNQLEETQKQYNAIANKQDVLDLKIVKAIVKIRNLFNK